MYVRDSDDCDSCIVPSYSWALRLPHVYYVGAMWVSCTTYKIVLPHL